MKNKILCFSLLFAALSFSSAFSQVKNLAQSRVTVNGTDTTTVTFDFTGRKKLDGVGTKVRFYADSVLAGTTAKLRAYVIYGDEIETDAGNSDIFDDDSTTVTDSTDTVFSDGKSVSYILGFEDADGVNGAASSLIRFGMFHTATADSVIYRVIIIEKDD